MRATVVMCLAIVLSFSGVAAQSPETVFRGRPTVKISEGGVERAPESLASDRATNLECVVSRIGSSYYWASRENVELSRIDSGGFVTFVATNGSGYVRTVKPEAKGAAALMSSTEERFDYVEHVVIGLRSITYYGAARR